ncbi:hypothetical protein AB0346_24070, partial [Nocardia beijingensis]|uniref:hypothetical protein n=1 Tax=Nocardia beijingensis TaxID=95162 RepID=UPI00344C00A1
MIATAATAVATAERFPRASHGGSAYSEKHEAASRFGAVLLSRSAGVADVAVGTPVAGRGERELDDLIG